MRNLYMFHILFISHVSKQYHSKRLCLSMLSAQSCKKKTEKCIWIPTAQLFRRMAENGFAPPHREFCRNILSGRELKAESFKKCLHSVRWGVSL